ncbi:ATP-binding protein [Pseudomonas fuscovaginae UPB0736]|uniref:sensor histidine kinase n=1 Tax=Pseudomonas asplenii TaxID=53407 RepID=UPI000287CAB3|nr:ATP-binding protein [Pseudomonas fuscovaginae]UUQ67758.1 ATP-binding protein [Pseudomonas fuscovaginae UPB0736]
MISIRRRTVALIVGLLLVGRLIITLLSLHDSNREIDEVYDAQLAQNARLLQGVMRMPLTPGDENKRDEALNQALGESMPKVDGHPYERKIAFQIWSLQGEILVRTASAPTFDQLPSVSGFSDLVDLKQHTWRTFLLEDQQNRLFIWVGERDDVRSDLVYRIIRHTLWPNVLGTLILAVLAWLAIGWGLGPLAKMAMTLRARPPGSLEPLRLGPLPTELEPMQSALNRVLVQVQELLGRERRFIADAAHEMRTPLAVLRVHAQNLLEAQNEQQRSQSLHHLISGVDRTTRLVNQLLTMARLEPSGDVAAAPLIDLEQVLRESLSQLGAWLLDKGLEFEFDVEPGEYKARISADALAIALHNLLTNAANFSEPQGLISVGLSSKDQSFELSVQDQGPGIDEDQRERLFERFYSRGNDQGAGLGLTIVQTIARQVGGQVRLENRDTGGLCATLTIPRP